MKILIMFVNIVIVAVGASLTLAEEQVRDATGRVVEIRQTQ